MKKITFLETLIIAFGLIFIGCSTSQNPVNDLTELPNSAQKAIVVSNGTAQAPPTPLIPVSGVGTIWPFTSTNFIIPQDPINLIFIGQADPRALRATLLFLNWQDAIGGMQTAYAEPKGWVGNAVQMEFGAFDPARYHIRFFHFNNFTLANCHFEFLIPGTTSHQVTSWEDGEQFVKDAFQSVPGLLAGSPTEALLPGTANFRGRPADGKATILNVAGNKTGSPIIATQKFDVPFNQFIPKPFCASGPFDFLLVQGLVKFRQQVIFTPAGNFISQFTAVGHLNLTPVDITTTPPTPIGATYRARVNEHHKGIMTNNVTLVSSFQMFIEIPPAGPFRGQLIVKLNVGPGQSSAFSLATKCLP